jgi:hypothetical protein
MADFQGGGFRLQLPDDYEDASAYTFLLPALMPAGGTIMPHIVVRSEAVAADLDLRARMTQLRAQETAALPGFTLLSEAFGRRGDCDAATLTVEWGPAEARLRQRRAYVLVQQPKPRLYQVAATSLAEHFAASEAVFNRVINSFSVG